MRFLLSQVLFQGRQSALQSSSLPSSLVHRCCFLPTIQTASATFRAHVSYKTNPVKTTTNPNIKDKIPENKRAIKRPFVPPPTKTEEELIQAFPYIVRRTPYSQVPLYRKFMSGGNRCLIILKKVDGDRRKLAEDLATALSLDRKDIRVNPTTQHIEIKGDYLRPALDWLLEAGF